MKIKKHEDIETDKDADSNDMRKKIKIGGVDAEGSKETFHWVVCVLNSLRK